MKNKEVATYGAGCFWCIEAVVQRLKGVEKVVSGYTGGTVKEPTYRDICSGSTGHAEVVQVTFDPTEISYEDLIIIFMTNHDPTTLDRQGADQGTQYRSAIFYHDDIQRVTVETDPALSQFQTRVVWVDKSQNPHDAFKDLSQPARDYDEQGRKLEAKFAALCTFANADTESANVIKTLTEVTQSKL